MGALMFSFFLFPFLFISSCRCRRQSSRGCVVMFAHPALGIAISEELKEHQMNLDCSTVQQKLTKIVSGGEMIRICLPDLAAVQAGLPFEPEFLPRLCPRNLLRGISSQRFRTLVLDFPFSSFHDVESCPENQINIFTLSSIEL